MWSKLSRIVLFVLIVIAMQGCSKTTEQIQMLTAKELLPLQVGKVFIYQVDSLKINSTQNFEPKFDAANSSQIQSCLFKDSVESIFKDLVGNTCYQIFRYVKDTVSSNSNWQYLQTLVYTYENSSIKLLDDNLTFVKLITPVNEEVQWFGNQYINTTSQVGSSSNIYGYLDKWQYFYETLHKPLLINGISYDSTYTIYQQDQYSPDIPFTSQNLYQSRIYFKEIYAKGVGLISRENIRWTWQTNYFTDNPLSADGKSFGIRQTLLQVK